MSGCRDRPPVDANALRSRVAGRRGRAYWRSLEELAQSPEFAAYLEDEFPRFAAAGAGALDRRRFLQLMAASFVLGGVSGCGPEPQPRELLPYVEAPPGVVPGIGRDFATATTLGGYATGVLVRHQMGRPIKVEGNPDHPASLGATSAIGQASILGLYDPNRAQLLTHRGTPADGGTLVAALIERRRRLGERAGRGLSLLTDTVTSPSLAAQLTALRHALPEMRWHQWEPLHRDPAGAAARRAFGRPLDLVLAPAKADMILAVESDFLSHAPGHLRYAREFAERRRPADGQGMSRLYAIESTPTLAGAKADHRLALAPRDIEAALRYLAGRLQAGPGDWATQETPHAEWLAALAEDLDRHRGRVLVHAGREQSADTHTLVHMINAALGALGRTVVPIEPVEAQPVDQSQSLADLVRDMAAGEVDTLLIIGVNPVYAAPPDLGFGEALDRVGLSVYLGEYADETAARCHWHVPRAHEYEAWSDARAFDGTVTILQPQIRPLYNGRSAQEMLALLLGDTQPEGHRILREYWQRAAPQEGGGDFEAFWQEALRSGIVPHSETRRAEVSLLPNVAASLEQPQRGQGLTLLFRPDPALWDGRFANNAWLQEMPRPLTRLTWDNAAMLAPATAEREGVDTGDVVSIEHGGRILRAPVWVLPGQAPDCITLPLGFGRTRAGDVGTGAGFDAYALRLAATPWTAEGAGLRKTGDRMPLATVQRHQTVAGRDLIREGTLADFLRDPHFLEKPQPDVSLYPPYRYDGIAWAMAISLNACIGCQACVVACQAENNIPVAGKEEVLRGREMHWLRVDRYYSGTPEDPDVAFQPVPCMHCEMAPCEVVCPVAATVHDHEGLNLMVYNRCVGTRFCSNNCPYKVRRFNFFDYAKQTPRLPESWNPDVTVRGRGVMEKCTYCVQRTRKAQIAADRENRPVREGEVLTACQQVCPTQAIVFGDRNDRDSAVAKRKQSPLDYRLLEELNTRPRTSYEALIRNPNPAIEDA